MGNKIILELESCYFRYSDGITPVTFLNRRLKFQKVRIYWKVDIFAKKCQSDAEGVYRN